MAKLTHKDLEERVVMHTSRGQKKGPKHTTMEDDFRDTTPTCLENFARTIGVTVEIAKSFKGKEHGR